ncbi:MAG TPA: Uma2 family endonuclease [Gemmatimonadaceae bacterium]
MPALHRRRWTIRDVKRLIDERPAYTPRYELVDGELLLTPAPSYRHQRLIGAVYRLLHEYVDRHHVGEAVVSPAEVRLTPDSYLEPDVFVVPAVNGRRPPAVDPTTRILLAVEVLSPSSARHDRITKRRFFQRARLESYWIIDGEAELFEIWHPGDERPALVDGPFIWNPTGATEPLLVDVARFFAEAADTLPAEG